MSSSTGTSMQSSDIIFKKVFLQYGIGRPYIGRNGTSSEIKRLKRDGFVFDELDSVVVTWRYFG